MKKKLLKTKEVKIKYSYNLKKEEIKWNVCNF